MGGQPADLREPTQETRCLPVLSSDTSVEERLGSLNDPDRRSDDSPRHLPTSACGQAQAGPSPPCEVASPRSSLRPCSCPQPWRAAGVAPFRGKAEPALPDPPALRARLPRGRRPLQAGRGCAGRLMRARRPRGRPRLRLRATSPRRGAPGHRLLWLLGRVLDLCCEYYAKNLILPCQLPARKHSSGTHMVFLALTSLLHHSFINGVSHSFIQ